MFRPGPPGPHRRRCLGAGRAGASQIDDHRADRMTVAGDHDGHQQRRRHEQIPLGELPDRDLAAFVSLLLDPVQDAPARLHQLLGMALEQTGVHQDGDLAVGRHHGEVDAEAGDPFPEFLQLPPCARRQSRSHRVRHDRFHELTYP